MGDLTMQKWDSVIVDWVNCLELCKRIQNINALKSGEFFQALLDLLQPDLHTTIGEFLRTHYPSFEIGGNGNSANYTDAELTAVASLLLHFMSFHDRREEFIAPMCHKLNSTVQTFIKLFLEHFKPETTAAQFNDVVRKAIKGDPILACCTPKKSMEWNSSGESPFVHNSPLVEYFKTPAAKTAKMVEKDREIRRLQQELQLERDDKEDLNVEIREQKQRIQKISLEVHEKSLVISNLSARLADIEERPPTDKPREIIEIEKLLRSELADAQQYICELQSEHGELTFRKEEISKRLAQAEESACTWQTRAVEFESKLEEAQRQYKAQQEEFTNLQINYNELSTLLDELRQNKTHNNTLELDNSVSTINVQSMSTSDETLANTVVEIKLKECQLDIQELSVKLADQIQYSTDVEKQMKTTLQELEECRSSFTELQAFKHDVDITLDKYIVTNEKLELKINELAKDYSDVEDNNKKLKDSLTASVEESQKLEDELIDVKTQLEVANNNHQNMLLKHDELMERLVILQQSEDTLLTTNLKITQQVEELTRENGAINEEFSAMQLRLLDRESVIQVNDELIASLRKDLQDVELVRNDYKEKLDEKNIIFDALEEESRHLQQQYEEAVDAFNNSDFNLQALQKQIKESDNKLQTNIDRLEEMITGSIEYSKMEKFERIQCLLDKLSSKQMSFESKIENMTQLNTKLEEQLTTLRADDLVKQKNIEKIKHLLEQSQQSVSQLESDIQEKIETISDMNEKLRSFGRTVEELESLKVVAFDKEAENLLLQGRLDSEREETYNLKQRVEDQCEMLNSLEVLRDDLQLQVKLLTLENSDRVSVIEQLERQILTMHNSVSDLLQVKEQLQDDINNCNQLSEEQNLQIEVLQSKFDSLQEEMNTVQGANSSLQVDVVNLKDTNADLLEQLKNLQTSSNQLTQKNKELLAKCEEKDTENQTLQNNSKQEIDSLNHNIKSLKDDLQAAAAENDSNKKTIEELMIEIDSQLLKLTNKDSELTIAKEEFSNKDLKRMQTINELNDKITNLEEVKRGLATDLQLAKNQTALKQKDLEDLRKSASQTEKELNEKIHQHKKKIEMIQLTIENLDKRVKDQSEEKDALELRLTEATETIGALTAEKGNLSGEFNQTRNELTALVQQLQAKENDCKRKDDVIELNTAELLALKLEIEKKTNEISTLKSSLADIEDEKAAALLNASETKGKLDELSNSHKTTLEELQIITDMKNSLTAKTEQFKENIQTVFTHFHIKKKNMKQSLEELKNYKNTKEDEIKKLNLQLVDLRTDAEHLKEENHSVQKELQHLFEYIETKTKEVNDLQEQADTLKTTEIGYLQEISMLKEELNYTINKYTEALATEKEQKVENDSQIQNLTESLHEMLEKFNSLDKEHKELQNILEYNKKSYDEIKTAKESMEFEIVRLKSEYEEDTKNCQMEFQQEMSTLKKIEESLRKDIDDLQMRLQESQEEGSSVLTELEDAKTHLRMIQSEKDDMTKKLEELELTNANVRRDYDNLKIAKEKYLKESKQKLIEKQDMLQEETKAHESIVAQKEIEIMKLKKEVSKYYDRIKREEKTFREDIEKRQKEIQELHTSIAKFLQNIETLTKEKEALTKRIKQLEQEHQEMVGFCRQQDATILEHTTQIRNLQISNDVLEAGKTKMEKLLKELEDRLASLQNQMHDEQQQFEVTRNSLQSKLDKANAQISENEILVKQKCEEIEAANDEFDSVQSILTNMTRKMEATSRQLTVIHEDYEGKLKSERESFNELKMQYDATKSEMEYMSGLNKTLTIELAETKHERVAAEASVHELQELIAEMQQKYASVASQLDAKDASIASLQAELADRMAKFADATSARHAHEDEQRRAEAQLAQVTQQKEELIEKHACALRAVEENLLRTEGEVREVVARLESVQCGRGEIERLLGAEREAKEFLERRVADLQTQVFDANAVRDKLTVNIKHIRSLLGDKNEALDEEELDDIIMDTERRIINVYGKLRELESIKETAENEKENAQRALQQMDKCNQQLNEDKAKLLETYEKLHEEKAALMQDQAKEAKSLENMKMQYEILREQHHNSSVIQEKLQQLEANNTQQHDLYTEFMKKSQVAFKEIETMVSERNQLEQVVYNLRDQYITLQIKSIHITEDRHKLHYEQKTALEVIIDDIYKQFRRLSKMIYNVSLKCHQVVEKTVSAILENKAVDSVNLFKELSCEEITEKLEDLKDNANNTQVQLEAFLISVEALPIKDEKQKVLKENMQPVKQQPKEDEWRKKYLSVKQKLTLVENAKNNFEKKIKQLRDENKKLSCTYEEKKVKTEVQIEKEEHVEQKSSVEDNDVHYKQLLSEYIQLKQQNQDDMTHWADKCHKLEIQLSQTSKNNNCQDELQNELFSLKGSYRDVKIAYSKLQLDYSALEQLLNERNEQLNALTSTKESYSNLCEENTKLKSEIDTLKYKRQRDREQFLQHAKKLDGELADKVTEVRAEYDLKLEKMKERIVSKYKEQVDQNESQRYEKILALKEENEHYRNTVCKLKDELGRSQAKNEIIDSEKQYIMQQLKEARRQEEAEFDFKEPGLLSRRASSHSLQSDRRSAYIEERRSTFSLPRSMQPGQPGKMDIIEEVRYRRRTSNVTPAASELQMEDEGDMFNNKYLHDLKAGRPSIASSRESSSSRLSEFAYRNSLCPPHLKSSYPAETQFLDQRQYKDDDLKSGNIDFLDDTMKTQLLPSEKHKKKDAGTTSYKRPGPPTPSKNGGRPSLQGNERVLRELSTDQKRTTPNPLRSLFSSSNKKVGAVDENAGASPKKRPSLNFFRR